MTRSLIAPESAEGVMPTLAAGVDAVALPESLEKGLTARLLGRVAASAAANRDFLTVRRSDVQWQPAGHGLQMFELHADAVARTRLWRVAPGAQMSLDSAGGISEWLVLEGELQCQGAGIDVQTLTPQAYALWGAGVTAVSVATQHGALLYERCSLPGQSAFGDVTESLVAQADGQGWEPLRQGVQIRPFLVVDDRVSMLVRFEPGATVPQHPHGVGEECLMVEGDLFLGDILLREGEFQFAPAGSGHGTLMSDVGCLLFFHGAIDPAAVDPAYRAG